jgi:hypothetical protein
MAKLSKSWFQLENKLLSLGGTEVGRRSPATPVSRLARTGKLFTQPVRLRRGVRQQCHRNAAEVWAQDVERYKLCKGYALGDDGRWIAHSWLLDGDDLIETTYRMEKYFGIVLSPEEACRSWYSNFLVWRHPGPTRLFYPVFSWVPAAMKARRRA